MQSDPSLQVTDVAIRRRKGRRSKRFSQRQCRGRLPRRNGGGTLCYAYAIKLAETLPPLLASSFITALWSQMFISAEPSVAPV